MNEEKLGRRYAPDARDHSMLAALPFVEAPLPPFRYWQPGPALDQIGPSCVGYAWRQFMNTTPTPTPADVGPHGMDIYWGAQARDEWPGADYHGTSVRGGAKYMQDLGRIGEYVFDRSVETVKRWILAKGPVIFGTDWFWDMMETDASGFVRPGGGIAGGHAYLAYGYSTERAAFRCINSWGPEWGFHGRFWLAEDDLRSLLHADGEACSTVEIAL